MSARHRYDLPEPRPHEIGQESAAVAIFVGLVLAVVGVACITGLVLGHIMLWVLGL